MKRLLIVYHSQSGHTELLAQAVLAGARQIDDVASELRRAFDTGVDDLLRADALLIGTPENFGYMSGAIKDLFDRTYYPLEGLTTGRPYAVFVSAGNDGRGAQAQIDRIATGYGWKKVHDGHIARGEVGNADLKACEELGATLAAGLSCGIY
jgi:multimeric flavodoxin WrbA